MGLYAKLCAVFFIVNLGIAGHEHQNAAVFLVLKREGLGYAGGDNSQGFSGFRNGGGGNVKFHYPILKAKGPEVFSYFFY